MPAAGRIGAERPCGQFLPLWGSPHDSPHSELEDYFGLVLDHLPTGYLCFIGGASFLATTPFRTSGLEAPADDQSALQSNALKTRKKNEGMIEGVPWLYVPLSKGTLCPQKN